MVKLVDNVKFNTPTSGSGDIEFGDAVAGFIAPADAVDVDGNPLADGDPVRYRAVEIIGGVLCFEEGEGTISDSVAKMERTTVTQSFDGTTVGTNKLVLGGTAIVGFTVSAKDIVNRADMTTVGASLLGSANAAAARGVLEIISPPQGRLTLASGVPVMTSDQTDKTTIYYAPYLGNQIPLWDGSRLAMTTFSELSCSTTDTTHNPAAIGASKINDWFVWNDSGTIRLCHGPDWTNNTTRSAGTALTISPGYLSNSVDITNGPAAGAGTYVGTTVSDSSSKLQFTLGGAAAGGDPALLWVWNAYNRRLAKPFVWDTNSGWSYTIQSWRAADNNGNNRISFVLGLSEDGVEAEYESLAFSTSASVQTGIGIGLDATNAPAVSSTTFTSYYNGNANQQICGIATYAGYPGQGFHYLQAVEYGGANGTFTSSSGPTKAGLSGSIWC